MVFTGQRLANVTQPGQRHVLDEKEKGMLRLNGLFTSLS